MKKLSLIISTVILIVSLGGATSSYAEKSPQKDERALKVELTEQQKREMDKLYKDLFAKKKQIMDKYVEYGVLPKDKAVEKKKWLDKKYSKLVENGYVPTHCPHHHKNHRMHKQN